MPHETTEFDPTGTLEQSQTVTLPGPPVPPPVPNPKRSLLDDMMDTVLGPARREKPAPPPASKSFIEDILRGVLGAEHQLFVRPGEVFGEEVRGGIEKIRQGVKEGSEGKYGGSLFDVMLGAVQTAGAPITAVTRTVAEPAAGLIQNVTGISEPAREGIQTATETALGMLAPAGALRRAGGLAAESETVQATKTVGKATRPVEAAATPAAKAEITGKTAAEFGVAGPGTKLVVSTETTGKIAEAADEALRGSSDTSRRLFRQVAEKLGTGEIAPEGLPEILRHYRVTPQQFAEFYTESISTFGRGLNQLSQLRKRLEGVFESEPEAKALLEKLGREMPEAPHGSYRYWAGLYRTFDDKRRALLVSQWVTAIRNAWSQATRYGVDSLDSALTTALSGGSTKDTLKNGMENFHSVVQRLSPAGRDRLAKILDEFPIEAQQLAGTISGEANLGSKLSNFINPLNVWQEGFFRHVAFDSKLKQLARSRGIDLTKIRPSEIPTEMVEEATKHALDITFARSPDPNTLAKATLNIYREFPFFTTVNPFPRYATNAFRFLWEFNPARLLSPSALRTIATGTPEEGARVISRAVLGTGMLSMALAIRGSDMLAGDNWYQIKVPGTTNAKGENRQLDTRALGPFNAYLLFAEAMVHPERLQPSDWLQGLTSINRVAGTGLVLTDIVRQGMTGERAGETITGFIGQYFGGFGVPLRNLKTAIELGGSEKAATEEAKYRDTRDRPLIDPFIENIPGVGATVLPESKSPLKKETPRDEAPAIRLFSGVTMTTRNLVQGEAVKLGLAFRQIMPSSGIPQWDRAVAGKMGPRIEDTTPALLQSKWYQNLDPPRRRLILRQELAQIRRTAVQEAAVEHPELYVQAKLKGLDPDIRELLGISRKGKTDERFQEMLRRMRER